MYYNYEPELFELKEATVNKKGSLPHLGIFYNCSEEPIFYNSEALVDRTICLIGLPTVSKTPTEDLWIALEDAAMLDDYIVDLGLYHIAQKDIGVLEQQINQTCFDLLQHQYEPNPEASYHSFGLSAKLGLRYLNSGDALLTVCHIWPGVIDKGFLGPDNSIGDYLRQQKIQPLQETRLGLNIGRDLYECLSIHTGGDYFVQLLQSDMEQRPIVEEKENLENELSVHSLAAAADNKTAFKL